MRLAGKDVIVAGHLPSEIAAYAIAGVIEAADDGVALAATRRRDGQACATPTGMSAVLGGDLSRCRVASSSSRLVPATGNAAGPDRRCFRLADRVGEAAEDPPAKARVRALRRRSVP